MTCDFCAILGERQLPKLVTTHAKKAALRVPILSSFSWMQAKWATAACRVPALMACLVLATYFHQTAAGVVADGATLSVGLVGNRQMAGSAVLAMLTTTLIMAVSASIGTLVGGSAGSA